MMKKNTRANEMWNIYGSFGYVNGPAQWEGSRAFTKRGSYYVCSEYAEDESGVISRKDKIKNISPNKISVSCLMSKFVLDGGEYEVYTQRNTWQNESRGAWQPVITGVSAETTGLRNAYGAAPFFAIWNQQTGRGAAFHIMTRQPWRFEVKSTAAPQESNSLEIEIGVNCSNFLAELEAGQELELPEILFYEIRNKLDMDCYKIHAYMNAHYPRRELPVIYNTWLYQFERINYENVKVQIPRAKELGVEYFVIDGGWFGNGNFWEYRGDWFEYETGAFHGRMADISRLVRENGMKFGFWLEIEAGGVKSEMMKAHRDYYLTYDDNGNELYFFDFSNPEACEYMFQTVSGLVKLYQAKFIKFDFNQDLKLDVHQKAFQDYFEGYDTFLKKLKTAHPDLYMENCASGGLRMSLVNGMDFDSFWLSDNQSPYEGMRIFKDTLLRMPPQMIEKWAAIQSVCDFGHYCTEGAREKIIAANDALWQDVRGINESCLEGFLTGGAVCFSCDLNSFSDELFLSLKNFVAQFKKERDFWRTAVCRILVDTESVLVLEYSDRNFEKAELLVYTNRIRQSSLLIYPKLDGASSYRLNGGEIQKGALAEARGIEVTLEGNFKSKRISLERIRVVS